MNLNKQILVLNKSWTPIGTVSVRRAICLMYNDQAYSICHESYAVYNFNDWINRPLDAQALYINGGSILFEIPAVILLSTYNGIRQTEELHFSRQNLLKRDNFTCQYCGKKRVKLTIDHVVPRSKGGPTTWSNCVASCVKCNSKKDNKSLKEVGMKLTKRPIAPKWSTTVLTECLSDREKVKAFLRKEK